MKFTSQVIPEVILIEPDVYADERGYFSETYRKDKFEESIGYKVNFIQDNESQSSRGVLRGLHFQLAPFAQSKLVRVIEGEVLDIAVDIRKGSPTFGQHIAVTLNGEKKHQLFIPRGFAHGFVVMSDTAIVAYRVDNFYSAESDRGLAFNDAHLNINWLLAKEELRLSEKDQNQPSLSELELCFEYGVNVYE